MPCEIFEKQVVSMSSKIALISEEASLSYCQLNQRANQLAYYLRSKLRSLYTKKSSENLVIGIFINKCIDTIISILAVLKMGATYVPIDIRSPEKRIELLSLMQIVLSLLRVNFKEILKFSHQRLVLLDEEKKEISRCPTENLSFTNKPDDLMYIIYTLGQQANLKASCKRILILLVYFM